ncbi:SLC13 family permease [Modicisalibacter xianhensis]|uniref:Di-and tricarboxylate transporter n=1 Tax=Modicisalibacter xianhensis TaxID=442341 RepID=A0A1I3FAB7_9GAMM|nr:SLC13 family permease [Halomonas xianhensis]SFI08166.1 Di-and tricarboxylate transporter [Halomonas xianhensis]
MVSSSQSLHPSLTLRHGACLAAMLAVLGYLLLGPAEPMLWRASVIIALSIALWATGWLPQWLTAFVFFTLCTVAGVAPAGTVFEGFASAATWLVFSGLVIGGAIHHTGLGNHLANRVGPRLSSSYTTAIVGVVTLGVLMAFVMPSGMGRIVLMVPILITLADHLGYAPGRQGRTGIILGGIMGTFLPTYAILPANVPNTVLMGAAEAVLGEPPTYSGYLLLHFPVLGLLKAILLTGLLLKLYPDSDPTPLSRPTPDSDSLGWHERALALLLGIAVVLWFTDSWHGISPAWIGMLAALACLFPGTGLMPDKPMQSLNFEPFVYVAGIVSLGALAHDSGLGDRIAEGVLTLLPLSTATDWQVFGMLSGLATALGTLITLPGVPAVLTPLAPELAKITGWSADAIYMTQAVGFSTVLLPYQAPPLIVGILMAKLSLREVTRVCLIMAAASIVLLWPLDYLWWQVLGWV